MSLGLESGELCVASAYCATASRGSVMMDSCLSSVREMLCC